MSALTVFSRPTATPQPCEESDALHASALTRREDEAGPSSKRINAMNRFFLLLVCLVSFGAFSARANDVYVAQSSAGANNGADCADAKASSYFNSGARARTGGSE